ncbi:MAG TPA: TetR/AcrR family transcriptional regulator, partial [Solirubrobacterales bacterium]|nr:TetR/AcrR family transcriptional regulator [Solirubrobacterales bacterium]
MRREQRERLYAAIVASTVTRGYPATTVADLISLAGLSRATFYDHFGSKADCLRATLEELLSAGLSLISDRLSGAGDPNQRSEQALLSLLELVVRQPAAARLCLVDAYSAGRAGLEPVDEALEAACGLAHDALKLLPDRSQIPPEVPRAVIGGIHRVIYGSLARGEERALLREGSQLCRW